MSAFHVVTVLRENFSGEVAGGWFPTTCFLFLYYSNANTKHPTSCFTSLLAPPPFFFSPLPLSSHPSSAWEIFRMRFRRLCDLLLPHAALEQARRTSCVCGRGQPSHRCSARPAPRHTSPSHFFSRGNKRKKRPLVLSPSDCRPIRRRNLLLPRTRPVV